MKIGEFELDYSKPLFIGEVGINHNGDMDIAKKLIDSCVQYGWHFVKFQKRTIDTVFTEKQLDSFRDSPFGKTYREQKEGLEFGFAEYNEIDSYCEKAGIQWTASPWDLESLDFLTSNFDLPFIKIASASATDKELLLKATFADKPIVVSCGGCTYDKVERIARLLDSELKDGIPIVLMHCVPIYPCDNQDTCLRWISFLKQIAESISDRVSVGYSGHERGILPSVVAGLKGVAMIERHITVDRGLYGSDQGASLEADGMRRVVENVTDAIEMARDCRSVPIPYPTEKEMKAIDSLRLVDTV